MPSILNMNRKREESTGDVMSEQVFEVYRSADWPQLQRKRFRK